MQMFSQTKSSLIELNSSCAESRRAMKKREKNKWHFSKAKLKRLIEWSDSFREKLWFSASLDADAMFVFRSFLRYFGVIWFNVLNFSILSSTRMNMSEH